MDYFSDTATVTNIFVSRMEIDKLYPWDIMYSVGASLHTTSGTSFNTSGFGSIEGFHQVNSTTILIADGKNNCLRLLRRGQDSRDSDHVGECSEAGGIGYMDGNRNSTRFYNPTTMLPDVKRPHQQVYFIADSRNRAIREFSLTNRITKTWNNNTITSDIGDMVQDSQTGSLYITTQDRIYQLDYDSKKTTLFELDGSDYYFWSVLLINQRQQLLVLDSWKNNMLIFELPAGNSTTLNPTVVPISSPETFKPKAMLINGTNLYIAQSNDTRNYISVYRS